MNFLKGIVDGILAEDVENDVPHSLGYRSMDGDFHSDHDHVMRHTDVHSRALDDVYRESRRECIASLVLRYGEGCVQQLNAVLKTNNETVEKLTQQLDEAYQSLGDFNKELEVLAHENLALRKYNADLNNQIELLSSENVGLKSVLAQAEIETKAQEARISAMNELLKDNAATFNVMKHRCAEVAEYSAKIEGLKAHLKMANDQINALIKERDSLLTSLPDPEYRMSEALRRQDRAIAIAKMMAQVAFHHAAKSQVCREPEPVTDHQYYADTRRQLADLSAHADRLSDENAHLKDVNEKLHNMYADLSRSSKQLKDSFLMEAIDAFGKLQHKKLPPLQLIFIQPTRVLDLELDMDFVNSSLASSSHQVPAQSAVQSSLSSHEPRRMMQPSPVERDVVSQVDFSSRRVPNPNVTCRSPGTPSPAVSSAKQSWEEDLDIYDEILRDEPSSSITPPAEEPVLPNEEPQPTTFPNSVSPATVQPVVEHKQGAVPSIFSAGVKVDLEKSKQAWNDDLDELLKDNI
ncbi:uncharacterized protein BXIN_2580 [Babesia sp. Xinjiang]|uniref:uncharacterized protein n=1 Tax=Babesia sp. Xinjiang TaxID=462227 RepID=UPI000A2279DF|nr:uncharacterized protein BXIN_2580 [Babesia sp. Xinjiang]ORM41503.1 hypothetical protein BXIN_2580 [Babesia sp. Xinjiang]